ncbi:2-(3-amino-3-carboxypropyl)histidine synthase subunit 1-like [Salvia splendens]|uniref:2-(3-amino-3-carboxypropyl)histidine synthase subunit 1-like n=1 Tax=Salvia splendens TaxID=180675 RepID=UPI001C25FEB8|nr:2-(3-amino-3-carboxypropyl)histidine synthase subunit 1-like [Salvia splendens]XP_042033784.1 2-(3-amino-3-carboxypropyl)histidine synthase subunit 1-like [Salvia splendens]XP_042033785.1 2-(3-amino-3-carboxypropyl)histidine synthase subunit 1-like [Salvia splendens]XP_042033786.1 2-(3-amino-3-carboxypropyl)histidine synthase subunit 1-like [Salvia splendens]
MAEPIASNELVLQQQQQQQPPPKPRPKRFVKNQIPDSLLNDAALNAAISLLPANYNFEIHKIIWRARSSNATRVALQFPEGLLMYSLVISDILATFAAVTHCFILGDVTYGACCVDDLSARALDVHLLVHFGHSCLVPIDSTTVPVLYIFVEIAINTRKLLHELNFNFSPDQISNFVMAGTIQFSNAIRLVKPELENLGFRVLIPQSKPLSAGEVLGCTAPSVKIQDCAGKDSVIIFVADGRFHLEAFMIANPDIKAFRYDPYLGKLFLEEYDHVGMKENRRKAIERAKGAKTWGIVLGTLGRQGNAAVLNRLEGKMRDKGLDFMVVLISELSPRKIELFGDAVEAWVQIACPRLSIDWGDAFKKPLLTSFEAEIALRDLPGWWERKLECSDSSECGQNEGCCGNGNMQKGVDYPMDYYAQDGGEWNSSYSKKLAHNRGKKDQCCNGNSVRC